MFQLRKNRKWDYRYRLSSVMHHVMIQVSLKRNTKKLKEKGEKAVSKELLQIHMKITLRPLKAGGTTYREKDEDLEYLMFLKYKRGGSVKGRACADVRK